MARIFLRLRAFSIAVLAFSSLTARGQPFGIGALLNPEGSRLFPQTILFPRHPGKPDPRWKDFNWLFIDRSVKKTNYRLFLYKGEEWGARFAAPRINSEIADLETVFSYTPSQKFSYLLFTSQREFRQANVFDISEGVQGITSTQEATMAIPFWGEAQTFDHISTHEMTHQFQVQKINDLSGYPVADRAAELPLWFIEGMAEFYSLHGVDPESRVYLRDVVTHPDKDRGYEVTKFFEDGPLNFINAYKIGQAKIDFLETRFGKGTAQRLLERLAKTLSTKESGFKESVEAETHTPPDQVEAAWTSYLDTYRNEAKALTQPLSEARSVPGPGEIVDYFDISPDGSLLVTREMDSLSGITSVHLIDLRNRNKKTELIQDNQPSALSLLFFQAPTVAIGNDRAAYIVETSSGPEIETRLLKREDDGDISMSTPARIKLHDLNILEVSSLALSPDGKKIAVVEIGPDGAQNILVIGEKNARGKLPVTRLSHGNYSWRHLSWDIDGLLAAGDRTSNGRYGIYRIAPENGNLLQLTEPSANQQSPTLTKDGILFQSWRTGSPQAHLLTADADVQLTAFPTGIFYPRMRDGRIYGLVFEKGRYRLIQTDSKSRGELPLEPPPSAPPWQPHLMTFTPQDLNTYRPFFTQGSRRLDNIGGFLASGGFIGISAVMSDLMRDYVVSGEFLMLGRLNRSSASGFLSGRKGRAKWTLGVYREILPMLDNIFSSDNKMRTYLHREFGGLGAIEYPFNAFTFLDFELRLATASRGEFSDARLNDAWEAQNPGTEFFFAPTVRVGYDRLIYEAYSGPLKGFGAMLEAETNFFPGRSILSNRLRGDLSNYWHLPGRTVFMVQGVGATAWGDRYRNSFYVSSDDIMRAYPFNDDRLYGNSVLAAKSELRFPIGSLFGFPPLRGLLAADIGSIFTQTSQIVEKAAASVSTGLTLNIPPLSVNFMLSKPLREAPGPADSTVGHFTLRYLYL